MKPDSRARGRLWFLWPVAGVVAAFSIAARSPEDVLTFAEGLGAWFGLMLIVLVLSWHPIGGRVGAFLAGLSLAIPCFVAGSPLLRTLLLCLLGVPLVAASELLQIGPLAGARARLAHLCTWCGTQRVTPRMRSLDAAAIARIAAATLVLAVMIAVIKRVPDAGVWLSVRWLAGGVGMLALAEVLTACQQFVSALLGISVPLVFNSPHLARSIGEFWSKRWNPPTSELFRQNCFAPLARLNVELAVVATFAVSAISHALLVLFAIGDIGAAALCGAFFMVQPPFIAAERFLNVRRWPAVAAHAWTLGVLAITSPLLIEPTLRIVETGWGPPNRVVLPTLAALCFAVAITGMTSIASLSVSPQSAAPNYT